VVCLEAAFSDGSTSDASILSASDENGKTYTVSPHSPSPAASGQANTFLLYCIVPSGAGKTITVTFSKNFSFAFLATDEFNLSSGTIVFDSDAISGSGNNSFFITTPTVTVTGSDDLCYAAASSGNAVSSVDAPWTAAPTSIPDAWGGASAFILGATSNTAVAMTQNASVDYSSVAMSFKSSASTPSRPMFRGH
jgi:hypothetical protein